MGRTTEILMALLAALTLTACDGTVYYDQSQSIDEHGWLPDEVSTFRIDVDDTTHAFDLMVEVRNTIDYPYSNLFLFVDTRFPDGSTSRDTIECPLADAAGHWYGRRTGRYVDSRYRLRAGSVRFAEPGMYLFGISNGMRDSAIAGIKDIGMRMEYSKSK